MPGNDPRDILNESPMGRLQIIAVTLCVLLNALDGFDVLSISFASPGIAAEWGIDRAALGLVLSMELIGMGVGSIILGSIADRIGRRPMILLCLVIMASGMALAPLSSSVVSLSAVRFMTGIGIGGMLASVNAMVAEYSNGRNRAFAVTMMAAGYPLGAVVGGSVASALLVHGSWRDVFVFGAVASGLFLPLVWFLLPESIGFLMRRGGDDALGKINRILQRMGHETASSLPPAEDTVPPRVPLATLFSPTLVKTTLLLTFAYFGHIMTFYFMLKWIPKIVVDMGYAASQAGAVLVWASVGGLIGSLSLSALTRRYGLRAMAITVLLGSSAMVLWFGQGQQNLIQLSVVAAIAGIFTNAGVVGLYGLMAQGFPTEARASGTGFVIGVGRGGAALGPIVAGAMFAAGGGLAMVASAMALGSLAGAIILAGLRPAASSQKPLSSQA